MLLRPTGTRTLSDGTKIEETFCNVCRNEVNQILRDDYYNKNTKFEGIVEQQMFYGCVTPQKNPVYWALFKLFNRAWWELNTRKALASRGVAQAGE